jgi:hypothetical protein
MIPQRLLKVIHHRAVPDELVAVHPSQVDAHVVMNDGPRRWPAESLGYSAYPCPPSCHR